MRDAPTIPFRIEVIRKAIHFCSLSIPVLYYFLPKSTGLTILIPLTAGFVLVDVLRHYHAPTAKLFHKLFGWLLRDHETGEKMKTLNGATYVLLSATICVLIFPKLFVITAFSVLIFGDAAAALIGQRFGKHRIPLHNPKKKSVEGSLAFLLSAIAVVLVTPKVAYSATEYFIAIAAALVGTVAEALSSDIIDDNLAVPVSMATAMWILYILFAPELNYYYLDN